MGFESLLRGGQIITSISMLAIVFSMISLLIILPLNYLFTRFALGKKIIIFLSSLVSVILLITSLGLLGIPVLILAFSVLVYLGWLYRWSFQKLLIINFFTTLSLISVSILSLLILYWVQNMNLDIVLKGLDDAIRSGAISLEQLGLKSSTEMKLLKLSLKKNLLTIRMIAIFLVVLFSFVVSTFVTFAASVFWKRFQGAIFKKKDFTIFYLPEKLIIPFILALALIIYSHYKPSFIGQFISWNLVLVMSLVYSIQGFSLTYYYAKKIQKENWLPVLFLILMLAFGGYWLLPMIGFFALLGTLDFWGDFRKLNTSNTGLKG